MAGKRRKYSNVLMFICRFVTYHTAITLTVSCTEGYAPGLYTEQKIAVTIQMDFLKNKGESDEVIYDLSLLVFNQDGLAERCISNNGEELSFNLDLISGRTYSFFAVANFGYPVFAEHISEMDELTLHLGKPEDARTRMPMSGLAEAITITEDSRIMIQLKRMASMISIRMDRSRLAEDVMMKVTGISIGNCPRQANVFTENRLNSSDECFKDGYRLDGIGTDPLNVSGLDGISEEVRLFLLENMQRNQLTGIRSYIEVEMDYLSYNHFNCEGPLIYRFFLEDENGNAEIERNCHYSICICPDGNGLHKDGWQVDKTYMQEVRPGFAAFPESYIQGNIGDTLHLYCEVYPPHTVFDVGLDELEFDREQGIYEYIIDEDGHGVRLILTGAGVGIVYMQAGEPVNEDALWIIEVNLPQETAGIKDTLQYMSLYMTSVDQGYPQKQGDHHHHQPLGQDRLPSLQHG